ncbi:MAG TPA: LLM class F420-dependent oxidoreductase [Acidimicrobiales bacterium]|nr:LLM class F420-dependent oxidoreductase [Acidimicrobiales bacterium]
MDNLQVGVVYPQIELGGDPRAVERIGRATEELGFDYLLAYDHVLGAVHDGREPPLLGPYTEHDPFHDPLVMFAYLAGITERIGLTTGVIILPQRQTALVARQAADVDLFSGGRLRLGVGIGWNFVEYEALGEDFHTRGAREEEQIGLLRQLWTDPVVDFAGRFDRIDRAALVPRPARTIPIWLGGFGEAAFGRAARVGDGFMFGGGATHVFEALRRVQQLVIEQGRSLDGFGAECAVRTDKGPQAVAERMQAWRDAGGTHAAVVTMGLGLRTVDEHVDYVAKVATALEAS